MSNPRGPSRHQRRPRPDKKATASPRDRWRRIAGRTAWILGTVAIVAASFYLATNDTGLDAPVELTANEVQQARADAGCRVVASQPAGDPSHLSTDVPAATIDTGQVQPPTGGPHYQGTSLLVPDGSDRQLDVVSLRHNLEHGAVAAWYDPAVVDDATIEAMEAWSGLLNDSGFINQRAGAAIFVAPFDNPGISSGSGIALRSWGLGVDCDTWNETVANSFVIETYGNRDNSPEGVPFPDDTLSYGDESPAPFRQSAGG